MTALTHELLVYCDEKVSLQQLQETVEALGLGLRRQTFEAIPKHRTLTRANLIGLCFDDGASGVAYLRQLRQSIMNGKFLAFIPKGRDDFAEAAIANGAIDFIEIPYEPDSLRVRMKAAVRRDAKLCPYEIEVCPYDGESAPPLYKLTPRELEVAELMAAGHPSKRIGIILGISVKTVEVHRARVFEKTATNNLPELTRLFVSARPQVRPTPPKTRLDDTAPLDGVGADR